MFFEHVAPVLVAEDTIYPRERIDHYARLLTQQRPGVTIVAPSLWAVLTPGPSPTFFEDRFVGVYPVIEAFSPYSQQVKNQSIIALFPRVLPVVEAELDFAVSRTDPQILFRFRTQYVAQMGTYVVEFPDLCDNPWLEWVPQPPDHARTFSLFRQYPSKPYGGNAWPVWSYQSPVWRIEAETDFRVRDHAEDLAPFRGHYVVQPFNPGPLVEALSAGFYQGIYREIGDIFQLAQNADLSSALVDQFAGTSDSPVYGWMLPLAGNPPPLMGAQSLVVPGSQKPRRTIL